MPKFEDTPDKFNIVLPVPYPQHLGQTTGYRCGPATVQSALQIVGSKPPTGEVWEESELGAEMGTDTDGTDHVGLLAECLNRHWPQGQWEAVFVGNDPMTPEQKEQFWHDLTSSLKAGNPVPMNWVAPPGRGPVAVRGSGQPGYPTGSTCFLYVLANGAIEDVTGRFVAVTDSGFWPQQYVINFDGGGSACSLIPPKGYVRSNASAVLPAAPAPKPSSPTAEQHPDGIPCIIGRNGPKPYTAYSIDDKVSHTAHEVTMWLPARGLKDGLADVIGDPHRLDTTLGHAINSASLGRVNYEILVRLAAKLGVDLSDLV
jgi:hypothetical protein